MGSTTARSHDRSGRRRLGHLGHGGLRRQFGARHRLRADHVVRVCHARGRVRLREERETIPSAEEGGEDETYDILTIGSSDAYLFAGIGGPYWVDSDEDGRITALDTPETEGAIGLAVGGVTAAIALLQLQEEGNTITYTGLTVHADTASFVGLGTLLTIEAKDITVELNRAVDSADAEATPAVFDFTRFGATGLSVLTGNGTESVDIAHDEELLRVTIADATLIVSEFVYVRGSLAFETGPVTKIKDTDGVEQEVATLTLGGSGLHVFAGVGGPYWNDSNDDGVVDGDDEPAADGALGIALSGVSVGVGIFTPTDADSTTSYLGLRVTAEDAAFVGVEGLTIEAHGIDIEVNQVKSDDPDAEIAALDFSTIATGGFEILTGGDPITLETDSILSRVTVADATLIISEFLFIRGGFSFEKGREVEVTTTAGGTKTLNVVTFGLSNVYAFAGIGGPYWVDSNDDGVLNGDDTPNEDGALGVALAGVNVGLALFNSTDLADKTSYVALKATASSAKLVGAGDFITLEGG